MVPCPNGNTYDRPKSHLSETQLKSLYPGRRPVFQTTKSQRYVRFQNVNNFFFFSFLPSFLRRENQKRETSSQSEGSEIIEGVLWVHGAWENGERRIFLMLGHGFREISSLYIILSEPNMSETEDQIKTVPIQCRYPFYTGADLRPVKAPWAPLVRLGSIYIAVEP